MNTVEIERMDRLEHDHWWYQGLRDMLGKTVCHPASQLHAGCRILDAGCGTGENLRHLRTLLSPAYAGGFDISPDAVRLAAAKAGADADLYVSDICNPEIHQDELDLVISCDVISVAGIQQSMSGLRRLVERIRIGGLFILNVAAYQWLRSAHDINTSTKDRASARRVQQLFAELGLSMELLTYRVFSLFPAILAARLPSMIRPPAANAARSDLWRAPSWINATLAANLIAENWLVSHAIRFPWGSSVYAVGRKR